MIIAIDGLDGSGKETLCNELARKLREECGWYMDSVFVHSFPDYTIPSGKVISDVLHGKYTFEKCPELMRKIILCNMYAYNRAEHFSKFFKDTGINIHNESTMHIFDRYWASNLLYQGVGSENVEDINFIIAQCKSMEILLGNPEPDLYYFLRVPYSILRKRLNARKDLDNNESDNFLKAVYHFTESLFHIWHKDSVKSKPELSFRYTDSIIGAYRSNKSDELPMYIVPSVEELANEVIKKSNEVLNVQGLSLMNPEAKPINE